MKIAVSYLNSKYNIKKTIKKINLSNADYIHMDIMDGKMVQNKNFNVFKIKSILKWAKKNLDIHLMVKNPIKYLKYFKKKDYVKNIYFHPKFEDDSLKLIEELKKMNISPGIVIDTNDLIEDFSDLYQHIDRVLLMSVKAGVGGQKFIPEIITKAEKLMEYKANKFFEIAIDGGINNETIKYFKHLNIDLFISGSFICESDDFDSKIEELKK